MTKRTTTRRTFVKGGLAVAAMPLAAGLLSQRLAAQGRPVTKVLDFTTAADIAKAEAEGEFTYYSHDSEPGIAGILAAFNKDFPKIKGKYVRAQNCTLFSRTIAERSAEKFTADVIQFSEPATALDFQKRGGYARYVSPQAEFYAAEHLSNPVGDYFWVGVTFAGLAYNTEKVKPEDAPKGWKDISKPVWTNGANVKMSNSGMQFVQWYELRKLYGDKFWSEFAKVRPRGFDSRAQQFERLAKGDDRLCVLAEYAGYLLVKEQRRAGRVRGTGRWPAGGPLLCGVADSGPNPEAVAAVHRLADVAAWPEPSADQQVPVLRLGAQGRAADAGRQALGGLQAAVSDQGHGYLRRFARRLQQGMECDARPLSRGVAVAGRDASRHLPDFRARIRLMETVTMATIVAMVAFLDALSDLLPAAGLARCRPARYAAADRLRARELRQARSTTRPCIWNTLLVTFAATAMALLFGFIGRLDPHADQRALPAHARSADDRALLRDAAARARSPGAFSGRRKAASSIRSGASSAARRR